jgi:hypothetical protein
VVFSVNTAMFNMASAMDSSQFPFRVLPLYTKGTCPDHEQPHDLRQGNPPQLHWTWCVRCTVARVMWQATAVKRTWMEVTILVKAAADSGGHKGAGEGPVAYDRNSSAARVHIAPAHAACSGAPMSL